MKLKLAVAALTTFSACLFMTTPAQATEYPTVFQVEAVKAKEMELVDSTGNIWISKDPEDWQKGDLAAAIMDDRGTESIYDDSIVSLRYVGVVDYFRK